MERVQIQGKGNRVSFSLKLKPPLSLLKSQPPLSLSRVGPSPSLGVGPFMERAGYGHPSIDL